MGKRMTNKLNWGWKTRSSANCSFDYRNGIIEIAMEHMYLEIICHVKVQGLLFQKWDPSGSMSYFKDRSTFVFASFSAVVYFVACFLCIRL